LTMASTAAGKQRQTGDLKMAEFFEEATGMLDKIKHTAANVTTCQNEIDQVFARAGELLDALLADSTQLEDKKVQDAAALVDETFKSLHKHVLRFAIYGRPKAFINHEEISSFFESFNIEMDNVLKSFAITEHRDVQDWEGDYYQAKLEDEASSHEQLWEILNNESDLKVIMEMGGDAPAILTKAIRDTITFPHTSADRKKKLANAVKKIESHNPTDLVMMQPSFLFSDAGPARLSAMKFAESRPSSSTSGSQSRASPSSDPNESPAAKAKREEAEKERAMASSNGEYEDTPLPRWEPRRPPPGKGPGSMDSTTEASRAVEDIGAREAQPPPPDLTNEAPPPGYS